MERRDTNLWIRIVVLSGELLCLAFMIWLTMYQNDFVLREHVLMYRRMTVVLGLCYIISNLQAGIVLHRRIVRGDQILFHTLKSNAVFFVTSLVVLFVLDSQLFDWRVLPILYVGQLLLSLSYRWALRNLLKNYRRQSSHRVRVLFVGDITNAAGLYDKMAHDASTGYKVLGYFSDVVPEVENEKYNFLGTLLDAEKFLEENATSTDEVYCTLPTRNQTVIKQMATFCDNNVIRFFCVPDSYSFLKHRTNMVTIDETHVVSIHRSPLESMDNRILKRAFDFVGSTVFLCTLFPIVYVIFGTWIKLTSPGPIFFKQKRSGLNGKEFWCYKFRSMAVNDQADKLQATANDPRKTRVGDFMRRTNIDELPQFINVWKGEMSMVGPRPHMTLHTDEYRNQINQYMVRHFVKPGITGYAQVTGYRGETRELWQMEGRVKQDIWYLENWSFALDLWIIIKTLINTGEKNAY